MDVQKVEVSFLDESLLKESRYNVYEFFLRGARN